jgi:TIR domain
MARGDSAADPGDRPDRRWDVALSFAQAQRSYVEQVAQALTARGVRCFYDADEEIDLWGSYLAEELPTIYGEQAAAVVVFISAEYAARPWTRLERRAALARAARERREYVLPARFDDTPLPGLLPDMVTVDLHGRTPQEFAAMIIGKLIALDIAGPVPAPSARSLSPDVDATRPAGAVRVTDADPRRLGVHAAISASGIPDEVLPEYVPRDTDSAEFGVRAKVAAAAQWGGFVLLVGASSVGKTRCAVEAVKALLPDWWLLHPADAAEVAALAPTPSRGIVVWLDELQRYLDGEHGLTDGVVRALLNDPHPTVIIGTLWPDRYTSYSTVPGPGCADPHARERRVLDLATVIRINAEFSFAEHDRACVAAARDQRLAIALAAPGYGLTQTLAAAPQLVARWQDAQSVAPYAWAVLTAALDAARLGVRAQLSADLLRAAASGYCTSQQLAEAPDSWFEQAMNYATGKLHGATAALSPTGVGMGQVVGFTVADYLIQYASRERRHARVPASTWDAVLHYLCDAADLVRLADSARRRWLHGYAISLYRCAADRGDEYATRRLADMLAARRDWSGLRARVDVGDYYAAWKLAWHTGAWDEEEAIRILRAPAAAGYRLAADHLATILARKSVRPRDVVERRVLADADDRAATRKLAHTLAERGDLDGLRALPDDGYETVSYLLADLLAERGDLDGLRARANAGDTPARSWLAGLLMERGDLDGLRAQADVGNQAAGAVLARLLAEQGDLAELRARADDGNETAADLLAKMLADQGDLDGLRAWVDAGDEAAGRWLGNLLSDQGRAEEASRLFQFGLNPDGSIANE